MGSDSEKRNRDKLGFSSDKYNPEHLRERGEMLKKINTAFSGTEGFEERTSVIERHTSKAPVIKRDDVVAQQKRNPSTPIPLYGTQKKTDSKNDSLVKRITSFFQINAYANETRAKRRLSLNRISDVFTDHMFKQFSLEDNAITLESLVSSIKSNEATRNRAYHHLTFLSDYLTLLTDEPHVQEILNTSTFDPYRNILGGLKQLLPQRNQQNDKILEQTLDTQPLTFTSQGIHSLLVQYYKPLYEFKLNFSEKNFPKRMRETIHALHTAYSAARPYMADEDAWKDDELERLLTVTQHVLFSAFGRHNQLMYAVLLKNKKSPLFHEPMTSKGIQTEESVNHICSLLNVVHPKPNLMYARYPSSEDMKSAIDTKISKWKHEKETQEKEKLIKEQSKYLSRSATYGYHILEKTTKRSFDHLRKNPKDAGLVQEYQSLHPYSIFQKTYLFFKFYTLEFAPLMMDNKKQITYATDHQTSSLLRDNLQRSVQQLHDIDYLFEKFFTEEIVISHSREATAEDNQKVMRSWYGITKKLTKTIDDIARQATELCKGMTSTSSQSDYIANLDDTFTFEEVDYLSNKKVKRFNNAPIRKTLLYFTGISSFFRHALTKGHLSLADDQIYFYSDSQGDRLDADDIPDHKKVVYQNSPAYQQNQSD